MVTHRHICVYHSNRLSEHTYAILQEPMLTIKAIPAFSDNYIWCLADTSTRKALVVDPGEAGPVISYLRDRQYQLDTILITHHHPDHTGGVAQLSQHFSPRVTGPAGSPFKGLTSEVHPGGMVVWEGISFLVLGVPGHTLDHIAFYSEQRVNGRPILFCGDTLFVCGCGRLFEGTPAQMKASLATLRELPDETCVYCAHEYTLANLRFARHWLPEDSNLKAYEEQCQALRKDGKATVPSVLGDEKRLNPFMRWDDPAVRKAASHYASEQGLALDNDDDVFAAIRHGKDHF